MKRADCEFKKKRLHGQSELKAYPTVRKCDNSAHVILIFVRKNFILGDADHNFESHSE